MPVEEGKRMEEKLEEMLTCSVCRDIFKDPQQLPCGHSMCMDCLQNLREHSSDVAFRCPNCREQFGPHTRVMKSYSLKSIADEYRKNNETKDEQTMAVYCDCCPDKQNLALKTCLKCEVSLCKEHIEGHLELPVFSGHPLVKPLGDLQRRRCRKHNDEVLRYYCRASGRYICNVCALESKQHSLATEARRQLTNHIDQCFEMLKKQLSESNEAVRKLRVEIGSQREKASPAPLNSVSLVLLFLWFIALYYAYNYSMENQALKAAQDEQRNRLNHIYSTIAELLVDHTEKSHIQTLIKDEGILTLDLETASDFLRVSDDLRTAERVKTGIGYPSSANRFNAAPQVLSAQCFPTGAHMWEVEAEGHWDIAVTYRIIKHEHSSSSAFGKNPHSWSLTHNGNGKLFAYHNGKKEVISTTLKSNLIAVMVDIEKGTITFGSVAKTITQLIEFKAELTQPVCLGVGLYRVDPPSRASIVHASQQ